MTITRTKRFPLILDHHKEPVVERLPTPPRRFSLNGSQGRRVRRWGDGGAMAGLAEGIGFGTGVAILGPPPHKNLNHISLSWKLAPARVPRVNFHQVGTARRSSRLLKKAISWQQSRFRNGCEEFPFETKDKQKRTQTGRSMSPLLDGRTERGAGPPPLTSAWN